MEKRQRRVSLVILIVVLAVGLFASLIGFISDFLWFKEMGYLSVFFKQIVTQLKVGIPTFIVVAGLVYIYLNRLKKGYFSKIASSEDTNLKKLGKTTVLLSAVFGIFATVMTVMQLWFEILKFANSSDFNIADPLFNLDISFYIFKLDFLAQLNEILIGAILGFVLLTVIYYGILMTVRTPDVFKEQVPPEAEPVDEEEDIPAVKILSAMATEEPTMPMTLWVSLRRPLQAKNLKRSLSSLRSSSTTETLSSL